MSKATRRLRAAQRAAHRQFDKDLAKARRDAAELRKKHSLCEHGDDERTYFSQEEIEADKRTPRVVCSQCGKKKLRVAILRDGPLPAGGEIVIRDILRREE
jgi:hypothetical protein